MDESVDRPTALILLHGLAQAAVSTRLEPAATGLTADHTSSSRVKKILHGSKSRNAHGDADVRSAVKGLRLWAHRHQVVHAAPGPKKKHR